MSHLIANDAMIHEPVWGLDIALAFVVVFGHLDHTCRVRSFSLFKKIIIIILVLILFDAL